MNKIKKYHFSPNCLDPKIYYPLIWDFNGKDLQGIWEKKRYIT